MRWTGCCGRRTKRRSQATWPAARRARHLFEEARRGREWLEFLSAEPEVPDGLLEKILAQTGPGQVAGYGLVTDTRHGGNRAFRWRWYAHVAAARVHGLRCAALPSRG